MKQVQKAEVTDSKFISSRHLYFITRLSLKLSENVNHNDHEELSVIK